MLEEVYINGDAADKATEELQKSTSLKLSRDSEGKISASGEAKTDSDKKLLEAINSKTIKVELNATTEKKLDNEQILADGAYLGNELSDDKNSVTTHHAVNPEATSKMDEFYEKPGAIVLHEVIESYIGGEKALSTGVNGSPSTYYQEVHDAASVIAPQSGPAKYDVQNGVYLYYVGDGKSPQTTLIYNTYDSKKK
ncbi:MAG TPA: hypothetical protein PLU37_13635 [Chitinophagaceae bacterium]|nr:hypothetical protein [Chitinophagaceae bacterium]